MFVGKGRTSDSSDEEGSFNDAGSMVSDMSEASTVRGTDSAEEVGEEEQK